MQIEVQLRGHYIDGQRGFGGICSKTKAFFLVPLGTRRQIAGDTRHKRHVENLRLSKDESYSHLTVNHSFVDPNTGAHTQGIENTWWLVKRSMSRTGTFKDLFESYLQE